MIINFYSRIHLQTNWSKSRERRVHKYTYLPRCAADSEMRERRARRNVAPLSHRDLRLNRELPAAPRQCRPSALFPDGDVSRTLKSIGSIIDESASAVDFSLRRDDSLFSRYLGSRGRGTSQRRIEEVLSVAADYTPIPKWCLYCIQGRRRRRLNPRRSKST